VNWELAYHAMGLPAHSILAQLVQGETLPPLVHQFMTLSLGFSAQFAWLGGECFQGAG